MINRQDATLLILPALLTSVTSLAVSQRSTSCSHLVIFNMSAMPTPEQTERIRQYRVFFTLPLEQQRALSAVTPEKRDLCQRVEHGRVKAVWIGAAPLDSRLRVILYAHGGAHSAGQPESSADVQIALLHSLSKRGIPCRVLSVDYSLSPESTCPTSIHECLAAFHYLVDELNIPPQQIVLSGISSGAALVLSTAQLLRDEEEERRTRRSPAGLMLHSPYCDLQSERLSWINNSQHDYLNRGALDSLMRGYVGAGGSLDDPLASPIQGRMEQLPPVLVVAGQREMLLDDVLALVSRLLTAQVAVSTHFEPNVAHGVSEVVAMGEPHQRVQHETVRFLLRVLQADTRQIA
jgi:epsilon-lactone hydrolase